MIGPNALHAIASHGFRAAAGGISFSGEGQARRE
jgi:hypothetical protein